MSRVAAIDCGTNSIRLLIADITGDNFQEITREMEIVRLGQGAGPLTNGNKLNFAASKDLRLGAHGAGSKRATIPDRVAGFVAQLKRRQCAAIKQVHADPVPAHRQWVQQ